MIRFPSKEGRKDESFSRTQKLLAQESSVFLDAATLTCKERLSRLIVRCEFEG